MDYILGGLVVLVVAIFVFLGELKHRRFQRDAKAILDEGINPRNPTATPSPQAMPRDHDFKS